MRTGYPGCWRWPDRDSDGMQKASLAAVARQQVDRDAGAGGRHPPNRPPRTRSRPPASHRPTFDTRPATTPNWICGMNLAIMDAATEQLQKTGLTVRLEPA
jgi:hypothetical protein